MLVLCIYGLLSYFDKSGVSIGVLLLVSFYIGAMTVGEIVSGKEKAVLTVAGLLTFCVMLYFGRWAFFLLVFYTVYEIMTLFPSIDYKWYFLPLVGIFIDSSAEFVEHLVTVFIMAVFYIQNNYVVAGYRNLKKEDDRIEQQLKKDMERQEYTAKNEIKQSMLAAENQMLEDRAMLSQTLHDKLGHNINGSIYQLEAVKLLMEKDTEKSKSMVQAVIDQLRTGMDEIRAILRKERPEKREMALLQLYKLCEDCNNKGVETEFDSEGDTSQVTDELWEVILDNAFEAVTNAMKYAKCKHIKIHLVVMNQMLRCSITDDGIGCEEIHDGMGISGMRSRVRSVGGTLSFETEAGFSVTMLLPMEK
ncbi:MAG: histidine kinase [Eubacterium sp.]|nr:histidine kinase [Eubacterium sp.]